MKNNIQTPIYLPKRIRLSELFTKGLAQRAEVGDGKWYRLPFVFRLDDNGNITAWNEDSFESDAKTFFENEK